MNYNWQQNDWPEFTFDLGEAEDMLFTFAEETGHMTGILRALPEGLQTEALINIMVSEAIKTSEIEGEYLSRQDVMSSIRNNLGLTAHPETVRDKKAQAAGRLMVVAREEYSSPLSNEQLFRWHRILLGEGKRLKVGAWRTHEEPMQIVSGSLGKEKIHFEAPPSSQVPQQMKQFVRWFNDTAPGGRNEIKKAPVRSAIAHLYFESIHPFEDGNGRIGRAIADKALSQTLGRPAMLSISQAIEAKKKHYYSALETAQRSNEITAWVRYFVATILEARSEAKRQIEFTLNKTRFFDQFRSTLNDRQLKGLKRMLEEGEDRFKGGMTASKYAAITGASKATATRDLQELAEIGALLIQGGGRSTHYFVNLNMRNEQGADPVQQKVSN
jgi:Fic family protein